MGRGSRLTLTLTPTPTATATPNPNPNPNPNPTPSPTPNANPHYKARLFSIGKGAVGSYGVVPDLPPGLALDPATGVITGSPEAARIAAEGAACGW